ncbi:MAG TPA: glycosyltransferase, partial [Bacillota bacterium]|nr:glycosyltransferase [Bacillota bacterium]
MLLSIGMMVKDEEKYLEECLQGLRPILDAVDSELIIVDTGSTDRTVEIAKKYTDRVYHHKWTGHFGEMRNTVLKYAKGQWFFFIDADEIIDDYADIVDFFTSKRHKKANAAFFLLKNVLSKEDNDSYGYAHMLRFFRKDKEFHFRGAVHEQPVYKPPVAYIKASAVHYGYLNDDAGLMEYKYKRNVEILEKELEKDPENVYYWFQLAQSYGMYGDKDKGLDAILKAYSLMKADKKPKYRMSVYIHLAMSYFNHGMYKKVIEVCNEGCRLREGYFDLYYFRAMSQFELGDFEDALKSFEQYFEEVEKFRKNEGLVDFSVPFMTVRFYDHAILHVGVIYKKLGNYQKSLEYVDKINDKKVYKSIIPHVVEIYMEQQRFEDLKTLYETKVAEDEDLDEVFLNAFEVYRRKMDLRQKKHWSKLFSGELSDYGLLNSIRLLKDTDDISPSL